MDHARNYIGADRVPIQERINLRYRDFVAYGIEEGHARILVMRGKLPKPRKPNGRTGIALFDRLEVEAALRQHGYL